jgi:hypothetical protein
MKKITLLFLIIIFALPIITLADNKDVSLEDKTKAAFIYNFTKYIQWPDDTLKTFNIAILGNSEILIPLKEIEKKKKVDNRKLKIKHYHDISDIDTCHILFISKSEEKKLPEILDSIGTRKILTIGDTEGFAEKGVAINFKIVKGKIRFEINSDVLDNLKLQVSSQLLKLAIFVEGKKKDE